MSTCLFTIGHSRHSTEHLVKMLRTWRVARLVDVRRVPFSRLNPQFNRNRLPDDLLQCRIVYQHLEDLGGLRDPAGADKSRNTAWRNAFLRSYADHAQTTSFQDALRVLSKAAMQETCAIMCAEADWRQCHRQIIADYLLLRDFEVLHILSDGTVERAHRTPFAHVRSDGTLGYWKLPEQQLPLDLFG
jgi:uncharacterized protein (DUF488 family)